MVEKTFIRVTNKMIYDEIKEVKEHVIETNGKVKLNSWVSKLALGLILTLILALAGIKYL